MAEEVKPTSPGGSVKDVEVIDGSPDQNEDQEVREIERKGGEVSGNKGDGRAMVLEEETSGEGELDKGAVDLSDNVKVEGKEEEETLSSGKSELSEGVEEKREEKREPEAGEAKAEDMIAESEVVAKEKTKVDEEEQVEETETEVVEENSVERTESEALAEEKPAEQDESEGKEFAPEIDEEEGKLGEEKTEAGEAKAKDEAAEKEAEGKVKEEEKKEGVTQEGKGVVVAEGEETTAGLVSSEEHTGEAEKGVTSKWIVWKNEFSKKFNSYFHKKWVVSGTAFLVLIVGLVGFLIAPKFRFSDTGEVKSLKEIAGPVYDMKFFLPLAVASGKTRFVKVTIAIELMGSGFKKEIDKKISEIREEVVNIVLTKSPKEVISSRGKELLRKEITTSLNKYLAKYLAEDCIKNTYFTELVVL